MYVYLSLYTYMCSLRSLLSEVISRPHDCLILKPFFRLKTICGILRFTCVGSVAIWLGPSLIRIIISNCTIACPLKWRCCRLSSIVPIGWSKGTIHCWCGTSPGPLEFGIHFNLSWPFWFFWLGLVYTFGSGNHCLLLSPALLWALVTLPAQVQTQTLLWIPSLSRSGQPVQSGHLHWGKESGSRGWVTIL